jgi:hypothetical protein
MYLERWLANITNQTSPNFKSTSSDLPLIIFPHFYPSHFYQPCSIFSSIIVCEWDHTERRVAGSGISVLVYNSYACGEPCKPIVAGVGGGAFEALVCWVSLLQVRLHEWGIGAATGGLDLEQEVDLRLRSHRALTGLPAGHIPHDRLAMRAASLRGTPPTTQGYNCCLFAYGQTGAGKTYSVLGSLPDLTADPYAQSRGLLPRVL